MAEQVAPSQDQKPAFTITAKARAHVLGLRAGEDEPEGLALWVEVIGARGPDFAYDLYFQARREARAGDLVLDHDDLIVVVPAGSVASLSGAELDMSRDLLNPGLALNNPNRPPGMDSPSMRPAPTELTGDTAEKVTQVLEQQINPSIAGHGGRADLVAVEDDVAYLRLSGGCQGCGMASVTLRQGIEVAILDAVPEVARVVDVTDHASGTNPYYEASAK